MDEIPLDDLGLEIERVFERAKAEIAKEDISHIVSVCVVLAFDDGQKFQVVPAGVGREDLTVVALSRTLRHLLKNRQYLELLALLVRRKEVKELRRRLPEMLDWLEGAMYGAAQAVTELTDLVTTVSEVVARYDLPDGRCAECDRLPDAQGNDCAICAARRSLRAISEWLREEQAEDGRVED